MKNVLGLTGGIACGKSTVAKLFREHGVIRVSELSELVAVAKLHVASGPPRTRGLGILSVSGGEAGAVADKALAEGLDVPSLSPSAEAAVDAMLEHGTGFNPCDLTGQIATEPGLTGRVVDVLLREPAVSTVVYSRKHLTADVGPEAARSLVAARAVIANVHKI